MKDTLIVIGIAVILAATAAADEKTVNFSGTWVMDPARSLSWNTNAHIRTIQTSTNMGGVVVPVTVNPEEVDGTAEESLVRWMDLTLEIVQTDGEMQVTRRFAVKGEEERTIVQKLALDGSQCFNVASDGNGEFVTRTNWKKGKLINSGDQVVMVERLRTELPVQEEYSLSKNGKRLTIKTKTVTSQGVTNLRLVYNKSPR